MTRPATAPAPRTPTPSLPAVGGWAFIISAFISRFPAATVQLGVLLVAVASGYGFEVGGWLVAAIGIGSAVGAPLIGRWSERVGPAPVIGVAVAGQLGALAAFTYGINVNWTLLPLLAAAFVIGACNPQIGAIARSRWAQLGRRHPQGGVLISRALGYESAVDELSFVAGPALASVLMFFLSTNGTLAAMFVFLAIGEGLFLYDCIARHREWRAYIESARITSAQVVAAKIPAVIILPLVTTLAVGTIFGATQTALAARLDLVGQSSLAGLVYCFMGVGSAIMSIIAGRLPASVPFSRRLAGSGLILVAALVALMLISSPAAMAGLTFAAGFGVGMALVTCFSMAEVITPAARLTTAMAWMATAIVLGVSLGATLSGSLTEGIGVGAAFAVAPVAGALIAASGIITRFVMPNPIATRQALAAEVM